VDSHTIDELLRRTDEPVDGGPTGATGAE
jgi:hypothetical protein